MVDFLEKMEVVKENAMIKLDIGWGKDFYQAVKYGIEEATIKCEDVWFEFNGVIVVLAKESNLDLIYRDWSRGMSGYLGKKPTVGPYPVPILTQTEIDSDNKIEAENEAARQAMLSERNKEEKLKRDKLKSILANSGGMEFSDKSGWDTFVNANKDGGYGEGIIKYAEKWARLMQKEMSNGKTLAKCASDTSYAADDEGITGFMYGVAVAILSKCWKHGEQLRRWHNKDTQIGTEGDKANENGGVLNPAMLNIR